MRQDIHIFGGNKMMKTIFFSPHYRISVLQRAHFLEEFCFSNLFCCLLQYYKEIHTCQSSYRWIRALETHNSVAVNSFDMMGSSNEKRSLSAQCLEVRWMLYKTKMVWTFVQLFWRKDRQLKSQKIKIGQEIHKVSTFD